MIGLAVGAVLVAGVIWLPAAIRGDYYEITDPLVYMGLPMMVVGVTIGALVGALAPRVSRDGPPRQAQRFFRSGRAVVAMAVLSAVLLAMWFLLEAIGVVDAGLR